MLWGAAVGSDRVCGKGHTKCSLELQRRVLPSLFLARQGQPWAQLLASAPGLAVQASQSSGEGEIHPCVLEVG